jgi:hypothetical protein
MTQGTWIRLIRENPAAVLVDLFHFVHCCCCWSHTLWASRHILVCLCTVYFPGFFSGIHLGCDSGFWSRSSICHSCLCCFQHWSFNDCCTVLPPNLVSSICFGILCSTCSGRQQFRLRHPWPQGGCPR